MPPSFHRPRGVVCLGCNGQYFAASLPIHQKSCFQRNGFVEIACPVCCSTVRTGEYHAHASECTGPPHVPAIQSRHSKAPVSTHDLNAAEPDGRVRCKRCERAFLADRIAKHQAVCIGTKRELRHERGGTAVANPERTMTPGRRRKSPRRLMNEVSRSAELHHVQMSFSIGDSGRYGTSGKAGGSWGRDLYKNSKQFDIVHRDCARQLGGGYEGRYGAAGSTLNLSHSTATSAGNPLAMARSMTLR